MRTTLTAGLLAGFILSASGLAAASPAAGTQYAGVMTNTVNTKTAYVGEPVTATHVTSQSGDVAGAKLYGTVTSVTHAGQGRPAKLEMTFTKLVLPSGATYAVDGVVTGMQAQTKNNAVKEAAGTVAGMIVGNIIGKTIFHASGGGFLGAAGGFLVAKNSRQDMTVPAGSTVRVTLRSVRRQSSHY